MAEMIEEVEYEGLEGQTRTLLCCTCQLSPKKIHVAFLFRKVGVNMLAGALAGISEHTVMFPIDSIKVSCPLHQAE